MQRRISGRLAVVAFGAGLLAAGATAASADEGEREAGRGKQLYMAHCASCHGADGQGSGPVAPFLTISPSNLTKIAERNGGQFPFLEVYRIIDGRTTVRGHGESQMPVWGDTFRTEADEAYGRYGSEPFVQARVSALTVYLAAIQE